ncbi:MAG: replicative DNA helicase [Symplocastrum torsivum CPER-KK1]|jgi:replicative DNA helicase|uniref:Replicative DNA helicase n=1 Tax=Symplocastrum torsivum CPER-KK1 TaxID=450513 RepID=A0A951UCP0_9CYAN|nr:replicative DNA helicase [Symplocastrum torsivum CPER-KK1]
MNFSFANNLPPQNVDAEESILGGILLDPEAIGRVAELLRAEAFYINSHKEIYKATLVLHNQGKPTDLMSVTTWLSDHELLEKVGGQSKLAQLVERTVSAVNVDRYAALVMDKYLRRQMIQAGNEIVQLGHETSIELETVLDQAEQKVFSISTQKASERYQLEDTSEMGISLFANIETGKRAGELVGWYDLEALTGGVHRKTLSVIGGATSMGKTQVMLGLGHAIMTELNQPVLFFSCEMDKDSINQRLLARLSGIHNSRLFKGPLPGGVKEDEWELLAQAIRIFSNLPWMVYDEPNPSISTIRSVVKQAILRQGQLGAVFLDYVQMLSLGSAEKNRNLELGQITRELRAIAKDFDVPFYLGSQINREVEKRNNKRPTKADLRDSGEIAEVADAVIMLYRDAYYSKNSHDNTIELIVDKNRIYGKVGTAKMLVSLEISKFMPIAGLGAWEENSDA